MTFAWLALLAASPVGLHLTEAAELPQAEAMVVVRTLADAVALHSGLEVVVDDPVWSGCAVGDPCVDVVRNRTRTKDVVLVRVIAGLTLLRVVAVRVGGAPVEVDVARDDPAPGCRTIAEKLFVAGRPQLLTPPTAPRATVPIETAPSVLPWVAVGGATLALAVGAGFGISSRRARTASQGTGLAPSDFDRLADRTQSHAIVADVSFVVAAVAGVAAGVLWWTD